MSSTPQPSVARIGGSGSKRSEFRDGSFDDGGLAHSFFADGESIRSACNEVPLTPAQQLGHLRLLRDSRKAIEREIAGAPTALKALLGLLDRFPNVGEKETFEAAWGDTVAVWRRRGEPGWSERYSERLEQNRLLVRSAFERIAAVATHRFDVIFKIEDLVRSTHQRRDDGGSRRSAKTVVESARAREEAALLSSEMLEAMHDRIAALENDAAESFQCMILTNLRLVGALAAEFQRYSRNTEALDDVFQVGTLGLIAALKRFDPDRGTTLSTYATPWIRNSIRRGIPEKGAIRVPEAEAVRLRKFRIAAEELTKSLGRAPHDDEVAAVTGMNLGHSRHAEPVVTSLSGVDRTGYDENFTVDIEESRVAWSGFIELLPEHGLSTMMARVFDGNEKLAAILESRYRIGGTRGATLRDIAAEFGNTEERARQLEREGIGLLTDYMIVRSAGDRRRFDVAARVLQPFERMLLRNLVADEYIPLATGEFTGSEGKPVTGLEQKRMLVKAAVSLVLTELGESRSTALLCRLKPKGADRLSDQHRQRILNRLFGPIVPLEQTAAILRERGGGSHSFECDARDAERQFRLVIESIADHVRDVWRSEVSGR